LSASTRRIGCPTVALVLRGVVGEAGERGGWLDALRRDFDNVHEYSGAPSSGIVALMRSSNAFEFTVADELLKQIFEDEIADMLTQSLSPP
jgi:hypothetical protein